MICSWNDGGKKDFTLWRKREALKHIHKILFNNNGHVKVVSHFVAHSVDFLDVGEYHLGVNSVVRDHSVHVLSGQKVGDASVASEKLPNIV